MSELYYIRVRGRVQGPFDAEKLRQMARRGQFSRLHEVSLDGQQWQAAKDRPELFATPAVVPAAAGNATAVSVTSLAGAEPVRQVATVAVPHDGGTPALDEWYYVYGGKEQGPVDQATLHELLTSQRLPPDTEVWRNGMADWQPAHAIHSLIPAAAATASSSSRWKEQPAAAAGTKEEVGGTVVRVLVESRSWVTFIAIMAFIYAALMLGGGLLLMLAGARTGVFPVTAQGMMNMVLSLVIGAGAWMLMSHASWITHLERTRSEETLRSTLSTLKTFWVYVGIILIVLLALGVLVGILVLSLAGSFPDFQS